MSVCKAMAASVTPRQTVAERLIVVASFALRSTPAKAPEGAFVFVPMARPVSGLRWIAEWCQCGAGHAEVWA